MAGSRYGVPLAAVLMLLVAGGAHAWTCSPGYKDCDKNWTLNGCEVNINTDVNNCGDCGIMCSSQCGVNVIPACSSGKCEFSCKPPYLDCDSNWKNGCEVDGSQDVNNCGSCGNKCVAPPFTTATCSGGKCVYTCKPGWKDCDGSWVNGCETDVGQDPNNCGNCGRTCPAAPNATPKCGGSKCGYTCKPTFADCDGNPANGCEVCTGNDPNNCGACGVTCAAAPNADVQCNGGKCVYTCKPGYSNCDGDWSNGCEASTGTDTNNCGACGTVCASKPNASTSCSGGKCVYTCKPGYSNCDGDWTNGCEVSTGSDSSNCGACGTVCADMPNAVTSCSGGKCVYTCKPGYSNCDGDWSNGCEVSTGTDSSNCGTCGVVCQTVANAVTSCTGGQCVYTCTPGYSNCDGDWTNGCEASTGSDTNNCGACGTVCNNVPNAVTKCYNGKCDYYCKPGFSNCDGDWTNGCEGFCSSDTNNCGACGVKCKTLPNVWSKCQYGKCVYSCMPGYSNCDWNLLNGCESNPATDVNNCGRCGYKCPTPRYAGGAAKCTYGRCETQSCRSGWSWQSSRRCCVSGGGGGRGWP